MSNNIVTFPDNRLIEDEAWQWIILFEGDAAPSADNIKALNEWVARSPNHKKILLQIARGWDGLDALGELVIPPAQQESSCASRAATLLLWLFSPILLLISLPGRSLAAMPSMLRAPAVMASVGVLAGMVLTLVLMLQPTSPNSYITALGEQASYSLADGSTLWLNTNSQVAVDFSDNTRRITLHKGEAHFDVEHDPARPFEVYASNRMVRAIGTAFSVFFEEDDVKVIVTEGKVELGVIYAQADQGVDSKLPETKPDKSADISKPEIVGSLTAGQSVVMQAGIKQALNNITLHEKQELKRRLAWLEGQLIYAGEPLGNVVKEVSRYSPVYIELVDPELAGIRIGGQFQVGQTDALFDILELGFGLKVSRISKFHVQVTAQENIQKNINIKKI